jgi:hypothetical protein
MYNFIIRMSSTPVAQLAAVFSSVTSTSAVQQQQQQQAVNSRPVPPAVQQQQQQAVNSRPVPPAVQQQQQAVRSKPAVLLPSSYLLQQGVPVQLSQSSPGLLSHGTPVQLSQQSSPGQLTQGVPVQLSRLSSSSLGSGQQQLLRSIRLPQEPVPASELGLTITR